MALAAQIERYGEKGLNDGFFVDGQGRIFSGEVLRNAVADAVICGGILGHANQCARQLTIYTARTWNEASRLVATTPAEWYGAEKAEVKNVNWQNSRRAEQRPVNSSTLGWLQCCGKWSKNTWPKPSGRITKP